MRPDKRFSVSMASFTNGRFAYDPISISQESSPSFELGKGLQGGHRLDVEPRVRDDEMTFGVESRNAKNRVGDGDAGERRRVPGCQQVGRVLPRSPSNAVIYFSHPETSTIRIQQSIAGIVQGGPSFRTPNWHLETVSVKFLH